MLARWVKKDINPYALYRPPLTPWWRPITHTVLILVGWLLYFLFLNYVLHTYLYEVKFILSIMLILVIVVPLVTILWVVHNINIFKHKGARKQITAVQESYNFDFDGKEIIADWDQAKTAAIITIIEIMGKKKYLIKH